MATKPKEETNIAVTQPAQVTADEVRKFIVGNKTFERVTPQQIDMAIDVAKAFNLNPYKREVHFTAYNGELKIIVGYEVYLKRAEATGMLDGWSVSIDGQGAEMKAVVLIYRKDWSHPFTHEVYKGEVAQTSPIWTKMPRFMLKKVAIGQAFRLAFPEQIGGMPYTEGELPDTGSTHLPPAAQGVIEEKDEDVSEQPAEAIEDVTPICDVCGKALAPSVAEYSLSKLGKHLCTTHQKPPESAPVVDPAEVEANLPATEGQKKRLKQLVDDGRLPKEWASRIETAKYGKTTEFLKVVDEQDKEAEEAKKEASRGKAKAAQTTEVTV
jgi:phage recombination protein Bet